MKTIVIVGLGLIGGSMALALNRSENFTVLGIDRDETVINRAKQRGINADTVQSSLLSKADIIVLALAPHAAYTFLKTNVAQIPSKAIITDVCGVKARIVQQCEPLCQQQGLRFVGGHPMAGKEQSGIDFAEDTLFQNASYILTPTDSTDSEALETVRSMITALGCSRITLATPDEHDTMIAFTSQLPHVLAGAYVRSSRCQNQAGFSAGSFRDVSRVATVDEQLWTELFLLNGEHLCQEIDTLIEHLQQCRDAIGTKDAIALEHVLRSGRIAKQNCG